MSAIQVGDAMFSFEGSVSKRKWSISILPETVLKAEAVVLTSPHPQWSEEQKRKVAFRTESLALLPQTEYSVAQCYSQEEGSRDSDSGDEAPIDRRIPPALDSGELLLFNFHLEELHRYYHQAKEVDMSNAYGKFFVQKLCSLVILPYQPKIQVLHSTNPKGLHQPGSMSLQWVVGGETGEHETARKQQRSQLDIKERVADIVVVKEGKVPIVFEVKTKEGGVDQNKEQMAGLLKPGQKTILGVVISPKVVHINLFVVNQERKRRLGLSRDVQDVRESHCD